MSNLNINWLVENFYDKSINFFDIGCASVSDTYMFKKELPLANFYAFECANEWKENNYKLAKEFNIHYLHCAVTNNNGQQIFYPSDKLNGNKWPWSGSICKPVEHNNIGLTWDTQYIVNTIRLDTFCNNNNISPDIVHIDVQGAEYKVFECLGTHRPFCIWTEVCEFETLYETGITYLEFNKLLSEYGYVKSYRDCGDELYILKDCNLTPYYKK